jgi:hypothetical protein
MVIEFISLLLTMAALKGIKGAWVPFSNLVSYSLCPRQALPALSNVW